VSAEPIPELVGDVLVPPELASLAPFVEVGLIGSTEVRAAATFARAGRRDGHDVGEATLLALAIAVRAPGAGHVTVDLDRVRDLLVDRADGDPGALPWPDPGAWVDELRSSALVAAETDAMQPPLRPLVLDGRHLYLHRLWVDEVRVASELRRRSEEPDRALDARTDAALRAAFGTDPAEDLQHLAARRAMQGRLEVVVGGPGTGKTRTIARLLAAALATDPTVDPALCAPTGKAAARMTEAVRGAAADLRAEHGGVDADVLERLADLEATTVHRLVGRRRDGSVVHHAGRRLRNQLVVVDEASMVDLGLMAQLLDALADDATVVLVGDPDQLASVEAGTVLADVVGQGTGSGPQPGAELAAVDRRVTRLVRVHRFDEASGISALADAVRRGDADGALELLSTGPPDVRWVRPEDADATDELVRDVLDATVPMVAAARSGDVAAALRRTRSVKVLCATRHGAGGVRTWSDRLAAGVGSALPGFRPAGAWEVGRPFMVTRNDPVAGVANGDCGLVVERHGRRFLAIDGGGAEPTQVPVARLAQVEPWWAMTIHKSQGSEFDEVVVSLPAADSPVLSRELVYTALTRARTRVHVLAAEEVLRRAVERPALRASGLAARLRA
jgi:exodeoxyribonuclease V alpha subunit